MISTTPIKYLAALNERILDESTSSDFSFKYVDISQVDNNGVVTVPKDPITFGAAPSRARRLAEPGSTLVSTVRTYLRAIGTVPETSDNLVFSTGFAVLRSTAVDEIFFGYACRSNPFVDEVVSRSTGVSYPAINPSELLSIRIPTPDSDEQRRIADFLDDRVARIDQIIAARERQIELAKQLPWSDFSARVSGSQARFAPLRRAIRTIADGPFGSAFSSSDYTPDGPAVIRLGNIGFAAFKGEDLARVPASIYEQFPLTHISPGNLLVASLGDARNHAGRACVAPEGLGNAMVKGKCYVAVAERSVATEEFLSILLSSPIGSEQLVAQGSGATRSMLNFDRLLSTNLPLPSISHQEALISTFRSVSDNAATGADAMTRSVARLREYKQALITSAVTGELDVTTAGNRIPG